MKFCIHIGILIRCSPWDCQMTFGIGLGFPEVHSEKKKKKKKWKLTLKPFGIFWKHFVDNLMLKRFSLRNCKMIFIIGRGFAERQILKKWKWLYLLNWVEYFEKRLRKHWYWQDLAQEIAKWHFYQSRLCRAPNSEKVKMALSLELWRILWWNFAYTLILTRISQWDCQMIFGIDRDFAEVQILKKKKKKKKWNWPYPLNLLVYFDKILHTHYYCHELDRGIAKRLQNDI